MIFRGKGVLLKPPRGYSEVKSGSHMPPMYLWHSHQYLRRRQLEPSQSSTNGTPAKLSLSQLCRHARGKDWNDQCCWPLNLFSYQKSISGSIGCHVAGASGAYENQALQWNKNEGRIFCSLKLTNSYHYFQTFSVIFQNSCVLQKVMLNWQCYFCPS